MGLDMYLYARRNEYASSYYKEKGSSRLTNNYPKELTKYFNEYAPENLGSYDMRSVSRITDYKIGYWRKANHIHAWFVHNCGNDIDECQEMYVSRKALEELLEVCKEVLLEDPSKAEELLPTQDGFFFGETDYNERYYFHVKNTLDMVEKVLKFIDSQKDKYTDWKIVYRASW